MTTTVIGTIAGPKIANELVSELPDAGFEQQDVEVLGGSEQEILPRVVAHSLAEEIKPGARRAR